MLKTVGCEVSSLALEQFPTPFSNGVLLSLVVVVVKGVIISLLSWLPVHTLLQVVSLYVRSNLLEGAGVIVPKDSKAHERQGWPEVKEGHAL